MKPTQEDIDNVCINLLGFKKIANGRAWDIGSDTGELYFLSQINPYNDDSLTGVLVKAVFPILAERNCKMNFYFDGEVEILYPDESYGEDFDDTLFTIWIKKSPINTALIEVWKKIEGHNRA